jgi:hypothetical protein
MNIRRSLAIVLALLLTAPLTFAAPKKRCVSPADASRFLQSMPRAPQLRSLQTKSSRIGNIVVLQADPELLTLPNAFDLQDMTLRFVPAPNGRYSYSLETAHFDGSVSENIKLGDDASSALVFKNFQFPYGRKVYDRCYINSNGSITFEGPDTEPPAANIVSGTIPRVAGFFTDLNPEKSGAIFVYQNSDKVLISWLKVPEFFNQNQLDFGQNTFQIVLYKTGVIDLVFTKEFTATQGIVGLIPGFDSVPIRFVDFSTRKSVGRTLFSFVENFHDYVSVDLQGLMKSLYQSESDRFDFVSLFSNFDLNPIPGAQAFAINVRNSVRGIGNPSDKKAIFKDNDKYGSAGRLQNITFFGDLHQYPDIPEKNLTELDVSLIDIIAHEVAHRWLTYVKVLKDGKRTDNLLGRDKVHWSFFFDTEGSFLEGSQILSRSSNSFETAKPFQRYSELDLYLMGLKPASEVKTSFYVDGAGNFSPNFPFRPESSPEEGVRFNGSPIAVGINDIVAANGSRKPNSSGAQKDFTHLFVLITKADQPATPEELQYLELVRATWTNFFSNSTGGQATMDTLLK